MDAEIVEPAAASTEIVDISGIEPVIVLQRSADPADPSSPHDCIYYLLGTAHVSSASCDDVRKLIRATHPDIVLVELCYERQPILQLTRETLTKPPSLSETLSNIQQGHATAFQAIYSWFLAKVGSGLDVAPGEEFRVAVEEARDVGAVVVLGDRPLNITVARVWAALSLWEKWKLSFSLLWSGLTLNNDEVSKELEKMKGRDFLTEAIREFGKEFPSMIAPLLTERDQYMVHVMQQLAIGKPGVKIVAVVGAGHLEGIKERWNEVVDVDAICSKPARRRGVPWGRMVLLTTVSCVTMYSVARWRRR